MVAWAAGEAKSSHRGNGATRYSPVSVATSNDDSRGAERTGSCPGCGAASSDDQRYCLECGGRRGPLPPAIAARLASMLRRDRRQETPAEEEAADAPTRPPASCPRPRVAAVAVMGMLALGVLLGSATSQLAQSAGLSSILLEVAPPPAEAGDQPDRSRPKWNRPGAGIAAPARPSPRAARLPRRKKKPARTTEPPPAQPPAGTAGTRRAAAGQARVPDRARRQRLRRSLRRSLARPYLAKTLPGQGELLANYYAVAQGDLANQIALLSGQGPTAETAANCPNYTDIAPGTVGAGGQVEGSGCVYPAATQTLPGQLAAKNLKWKAYVEDIGNGGADRPADHLPPPGARRPRRQPGSAPGRRLRDLAQPVRLLPLADRRRRMRRKRRRPRPARADLKIGEQHPDALLHRPQRLPRRRRSALRTGPARGPAAAESFLQTVVPEIEASPAYKEGGLIAITSAQAPQTGPHADPSACCVTPQYPNLPPAKSPAPAAAAAGPVRTRPAAAAASACC